MLTNVVSSGVSLGYKNARGVISLLSTETLRKT